ncbi:MAG: DsrE family protein [Candidatus Hodarchaeota archaeon]
MVESIVIVVDSSPFGKNSAAEAIRQGAGFVALGEMLDCKVVFTGDSVYLLNKNVDPSGVSMDSVDEIIEMADLSDLEVYVLQDALDDAGLTRDDLVEYENLTVIDTAKLVEFIQEADTTFKF